jgi:hypothetical protein
LELGSVQIVEEFISFPGSFHDYDLVDVKTIGLDFLGGAGCLYDYAGASLETQTCLHGVLLCIGQGITSEV